EMVNDILPLGVAAFGDARSDTIAWLRDTQVFAWPAGERPRLIAHVPTHASIVLGAPTNAGVPVLVTSADWAIQRTLAIPPIDKASAVDPPPPAPSLEGWASLAPLPHKLESLPACTAQRSAPSALASKTAGARFSLLRMSLAADVDGTAETGA